MCTFITERKAAWEFWDQMTGRSTTKPFVWSILFADMHNLYIISFIILFNIIDRKPIFLLKF